jgi:hypothetical protein
MGNIFSSLEDICFSKDSFSVVLVMNDTQCLCFLTMLMNVIYMIPVSLRVLPLQTLVPAIFVTERKKFLNICYMVPLFIPTEYNLNQLQAML